MRYVVFLWILCLGFQSNAQDSCRLTFATSSSKLSKLHSKRIDKIIEDKNVKKVTILGCIPTDKLISQRRVLTELRLQSIYQALLYKGIEFNNIQQNIIIDSNAKGANSVLLSFEVGQKKNAKVLKKTPIVQISDLYLEREEAKKATEEKVKTKKVAKVEKEKNLLKVEDFKKNEKIRLPNLLFEPGTHFIIPSSDQVLSQLVTVMKSKPSLKIELQGHICCKLGGVDGFDPTTGRENLSEMRARVVYLYLISKGIDKRRMTYKGFGSSRKLYQNDVVNHAAAMQNRRVEVLVKSID